MSGKRAREMISTMMALFSVNSSHHCLSTYTNGIGIGGEPGNRHGFLLNAPPCGLAPLASTGCGDVDFSDHPFVSVTVSYEKNIFSASISNNICDDKANFKSIKNKLLRIDRRVYMSIYDTRNINVRKSYCL